MKRARPHVQAEAVILPFFFVLDSEATKWGAFRSSLVENAVFVIFCILLEIDGGKKGNRQIRWTAGFANTSSHIVEVFECTKIENQNQLSED